LVTVGDGDSSNVIRYKDDFFFALLLHFGGLSLKIPVCTCNNLKTP